MIAINMKKYTIILLLIFIDQVIKILLSTYDFHMTLIDFGVRIYIAKAVYNTGISFNYLSTCNIYLLILLSFFMICLIIKYTYRYYYTSIILLSGAVSNMIDRILYGGVIDMIGISVLHHNLFICNIADIYISVGCILMIYHSIQHQHLID